VHIFRPAWTWFAATVQGHSNLPIRVLIGFFVGIGLVFFLLPVAVLYEIVTKLSGDRLGPATRWAIPALSFLVFVAILRALNPPAEIAVAAPSTSPTPIVAATPTPTPTPVLTASPTPLLCGSAQYVSGGFLCVDNTPITAPTPTSMPTPRSTPTLIPTPTPEPGYVSRAMLGDAWPLTVEAGVLTCTTAKGCPAVLFRPTDGVLHTVNGWAETYFPDLPDIDPIWAAGTYAPKKDIGPLIDLGLDLCS
jgi:hypothetical protein